MMCYGVRDVFKVCPGAGGQEDSNGRINQGYAHYT